MTLTGGCCRIGTGKGWRSRLPVMVDLKKWEEGCQMVDASKREQAGGASVVATGPWLSELKMSLNRNWTGNLRVLEPTETVKKCKQHKPQTRNLVKR